MEKEILTTDKLYPIDLHRSIYSVILNSVKIDLMR